MESRLKSFCSSKKDRLSLFGIFALFVAMLPTSLRRGNDYHVFYTSGLRAHLGDALYQVTDTWFVFKYHPIFAIAFVPFSYLPEKFGLLILDLGMIFCWLWSLATWARWLGYKLTPPKIFLLVLISLSALSAEFGFGQINGALFAGLTLSFLLLEEKDRPVLAGMVMTLVMAVKINYGLILIYGALRNWRSLIGVAIAALIIHVWVVLFFHQNFFNPAIYHEWLSLLLQQSSEQFNNREAQGFLHFFDSILGDASGHVAWSATVIAFILGGAWMRFKQVKHPIVAAYWMAALYLLSPLAWWYQLPYMLPAAFWLLKQSMPKWQKRICYCAIAIFALVTFNLVGRTGLNFAKDIQVFFYASLVILLFLIQKAVDQFRNFDSSGAKSMLVKSS